MLASKSQSSLKTKWYPDTKSKKNIQNNERDKDRNVNFKLQVFKPKHKGKISLNKSQYLGDVRTSKDSIALQEFGYINRVFTA